MLQVSLYLVGLASPENYERGIFVFDNKTQSN